MFADRALQTPDAIRRIGIIGNPDIHRTDIDAHLALCTRPLNAETHQADAIEQRIRRAERAERSTERALRKHKQNQEYHKD